MLGFVSNVITPTVIPEGGYALQLLGPLGFNNGYCDESCEQLRSLRLL